MHAYMRKQSKMREKRNPSLIVQTSTKYIVLELHSPTDGTINLGMPGMQKNVWNVKIDMILVSYKYK